MKAPILKTDNKEVVLIEPNIERDAQMGVQWLGGDIGRTTLSLMGVADKNNHEPTLELERERVKGFIENSNQLNWMIEHKGAVVGSVWVDLEPTNEVPGPAIHFMIGDTEARGRGVGSASVKAVLEHLNGLGENKVHSRHLVSNDGARNLFYSFGFNSSGQPYTDEDNLTWQNVELSLSE